MDVPTLTKLVVLLIASVACYFVFQRALTTFERQQFIGPQAVFVLRGILKWGVVFIVMMVGLHTFGLPLSSVWTAVSAVLVLVAVGFVAQWSILSNALCAVFLVIYAPFRIGDEIEIVEPAVIDPSKPGIRGRVIDISLLFTTVMPSHTGPDDANAARIVVPNNMFFQKGVMRTPGKVTKSLRQGLREHAEEPDHGPESDKRSR